MKLEESISKYLKRNNIERLVPKTVLFDMDGVLYDSMPRHAKAWKGVCDEAGIEAEADEFFAYEGRTGASTIDILIRRQFGRPATEEECRSLVKRGKPDPEPYLAGLSKAGARPAEGIGVDNAPLGVESASRAGVFTIGVRTGPLRPGSLLESGADIELESMEECERILERIFRLKPEANANC